MSHGRTAGVLAQASLPLCIKPLMSPQAIMTSSLPILSHDSACRHHQHRNLGIKPPTHEFWETHSNRAGPCLSSHFAQLVKDVTVTQLCMDVMHGHLGHYLLWITSLSSAMMSCFKSRSQIPEDPAGKPPASSSSMSSPSSRQEAPGRQREWPPQVQTLSQPSALVPCSVIGRGSCHLRAVSCGW